MADPICVKGDCHYTIPKGKIVRQNKHTVTRTLTKQQAQEVNFCGIDLSKATKISLETPKNGEKSFILSVEQPKKDLPLKPNNQSNSLTSTDYCSMKDESPRLAQLSHLISSGNNIDTKSTYIKLGEPPYTVAKITTAPSATFIKQNKEHGKFLKVAKAELTSEPNYLFCTSGTCDQAPEKTYNVYRDHLPRYNSNGELIN